jgi:hypothetical protein
MIHAIYIKSRPNHKWHLVSVALSAEDTNHDLNELRKQALLNGSDTQEMAVQIFDSAFHIPEYLTEVKDQKPLYN